jgi:protein DEK
MSKDLFKQAIAEAKSVREAAIANAKEALEESLTPHLKDMLAAKLQEMEETKIEEAPKKDEKEMEEAKHDDKKDETIEEAPKDDEKHETVEEDLTEEPEVAEAEHDEAEDDSEESEDDAPIEEPAEDDMPDGDEDISKLSIDQFKELVRDIIAQEGGHGEELPADDMDGGDIEAIGDEPAADMDAMDAPEDEEEIDLDELLRELEAETSEEVEEAKHDDKDENVEEAKEDHKDEGKKKDMDEDTNNQMEAESDTKDHNINNVQSGVMKEELKEALQTIETLKKDLNEVNLLNSKLLYVNKIFKSNDLSESQKVNIIAAFDKAESVKEVKLVFETVSDSVVGKKESTKSIKESKTKLGMASKATGTTASKPEVIAEVSDTVRRMQMLAGIIKQ